MKIKPSIMRKMSGYSLLEMLMVTVMLAAIFDVGVTYFHERGLRVGIDKTSIQMQLILNAAAAYFNKNFTWPTTVACLRGSGGGSCIAYMGAQANNPFGLTYTLVQPTATNNLFGVQVTLTFPAPKNAQAAAVLAGKLPMGQVTTPGCTTSCTVVGYINAPGLALNKIRAINFSNLYHHGGCIPMPHCPANMTPIVVVVPVSVSGINASNPATDNVYPIASFTAYVTGPSMSPANCSTSTTSTNWGTTSCDLGFDSPKPTGYWRACLDIVTENGATTANNNPADLWGQKVSVMAVTRCAITNENAGSGFSVWSN